MPWSTLPFWRNIARQGWKKQTNGSVLQKIENGVKHWQIETKPHLQSEYWDCFTAMNNQYCKTEKIGVIELSFAEKMISDHIKTEHYIINAQYVINILGTYKN